MYISSWKLAISRLVSLAASVQQLHKNAYIAKEDFWWPGWQAVSCQELDIYPTELGRTGGGNFVRESALLHDLSMET